MASPSLIWGSTALMLCFHHTENLWWDVGLCLCLQVSEETIRGGKQHNRPLEVPFRIIKRDLFSAFVLCCHVTLSGTTGLLLLLFLTLMMVLLKADVAVQGLSGPDLETKRGQRKP